MRVYLKCDKLEMNQTNLPSPQRNKTRRFLFAFAPPTAISQLLFSLFRFASGIRMKKGKFFAKTIFISFFLSFLFRRKTYRKKANKQCVTEPLSLLYYFFIGKFTILNDIKNLFPADYFVFLPQLFTAPNSNFICK